MTQDSQLEWQTQLDDLVTSIVWSPDGNSWATSSAAGLVIWVSSQNQITVLPASTGRSIDTLSFSADGSYLAAGGQSGELFVWDCCPERPPALAHTIEIGAWIEHLAWHPIHSHLAIGYGAMVKIWDAPKATNITTWKFDRSSVFDLAWHPQGEYLAVAGYKGVQVWTQGQGTDPSYRLAVDTASIKVAWSKDGHYLAAGNLDRSLAIVDWQDPQDPWTLQGCPGKIRDLAWIVDRVPCLAVATGDTIVLWQLNSPDNTNWTGQMLEGHQGIVAAISAHPQAPLLGSGAADGYACLWSATGEIKQILTEGISEFTTLGWHPAGKYLATGSQSGEIGLWLISA